MLALLHYDTIKTFPLQCRRRVIVSMYLISQNTKERFAEVNLLQGNTNPKHRTFQTALMRFTCADSGGHGKHWVSTQFSFNS